MGHSNLVPLFIGTGIFGVLFIFMPCFVKKGPNQGIIRCSMLIAVFSMWLFWATVYIAQMNPLVGPYHKNVTLMWWRYKDGAKPKGDWTLGREGGETVEEFAGGVRSAEIVATPKVMIAKTPATVAPGQFKRRMDNCWNQPDNVFECCNIPWLPRSAHDNCVEEPVNIFKLTCEDARCVFQVAGWLTYPGEVNLARLNDYYGSLVQTNHDWLEAVQHIKTQCLSPVRKFQSVYTNCVEFDIMYCAMIRMLKYGPLESWSTAAACVYAKQFVAMCPICPDACRAKELPANVCHACIAV